jgi:hypothetical protein
MNLASPVNSSDWDGVPSISLDGLTLYFCSARPGGTGDMDIWMTSRQSTGDAWAEPVNLGPVVNSPALEWTQSISADGLELYFSSARGGGAGGADLWVTTRATIADDWTAPVNLGSTVNSPDDDINPSISADGLCLLLFSLRPGGHGSRDIWMTTRNSKDDEWGMPVNLGPPINVSGMDQGGYFSVDGSILYFCSNRSGGYGGLDHYQAPVLSIVDFNGDGRVDGSEVLSMADRWGTDDSLCDIGPMPWGDGVVDVEDVKVLARHIGDEVEDPTLIAHWALDEAEGDVAYDSVGENNGTLVGDPGWRLEQGMLGGALECDGIDDAVAATGHVLNPAEGPFSVIAWIKGGAPGQTIVSQDGGVSWLMVDVLTGTLATELVPPPKRTPVLPLVSDVALADGMWHRVAFVWDGFSRSLYADGMLVAQDEQSNLDRAVGGPRIGCGADLEPGSFFSGLIDDVRIYNRAVRP